MQEIWKDIKDYEGKYQISNYGNVRRLFKTLPNLRLLKPVMCKDHYIVQLSKNGIVKNYYIHLLVAEYFIRPLKKDEVAHHVNHDPLCNVCTNIQIMKRCEHTSLHKKGIKFTSEHSKRISQAKKIYWSTRKNGFKK